MASALHKPAPKWYRITKKVWSNAENLFIGIWLASGHLQDSPTLLIFKLVSSFIKDNLDTILVSETEEYAPKVEGSPDSKIVTINPGEIVQVVPKGAINEENEPAG